MPLNKSVLETSRVNERKETATKRAAPKKDDEEKTEKAARMDVEMVEEVPEVMQEVQQVPQQVLGVPGRDQLELQMFHQEPNGHGNQLYGAMGMEQFGMGMAGRAGMFPDEPNVFGNQMFGSMGMHQDPNGEMAGMYPHQVNYLGGPMEMYGGMGHQQHHFEGNYYQPPQNFYQNDMSGHWYSGHPQQYQNLGGYYQHDPSNNLPGPSVVNNGSQFGRTGNGWEMEIPNGSNRRQARPVEEEVITLDSDDDEGEPQGSHGETGDNDGLFENEVLLRYPAQHRVNIPQTPILAKSITTLRQANYVDDHIMTACLAMLLVKFHSIFGNNVFLFNTNTFPLLYVAPRRKIGEAMLIKNDENEKKKQMELGMKRILGWVGNMDLAVYELIVIPIYREKHWCLTLVFNLKNSIWNSAGRTTVLFYNPMGPLDQKYTDDCNDVILYLLEKLVDDRMGAGFDQDKIDFMVVKDGPIQNNLSDCGPFVVEFLRQFLDKGNLEIDLNTSWATFYPFRNEMADLSRERMYSNLRSLCAPIMRSRLEKFNSENKTGLDKKRIGRRHSRISPRASRHAAAHARHFSTHSCFEGWFSNGSHDFLSPRKTVDMNLTKLVRILRRQEFSMNY